MGGGIKLILILKNRLYASPFSVLKVSIKKATLRHNRIYIKGNCKLQVGRCSEVKNSRIDLCDATISIGSKSNCEDVEFFSLGKESNIHIGDRGTVQRGTRILAQQGRAIIIGDDFLTSINCEIRNNDGHKIYSGKKLENLPKDIVMGDKVWIGANVMILKGAKVGSECVIGAKSLLTSGKYESNSIFAGVPARIVKSGINWER